MSEQQTQTWEQLIAGLEERVQSVILESLYTTLQKEADAVVIEDDVVTVETYLHRHPQSGKPPVILSHTNEVNYPERYKSIHEAILFIGEYLKRSRD